MLAPSIAHLSFHPDGRQGRGFLADLVDAYNGSSILAAAAYNAGPSGARQWINDFGDPRSSSVDAVEWIESIPFSETRNYVQRVLENAVVYDTLTPQRAPSPQNRRLSWYLGKSSAG